MSEEFAALLDRMLLSQDQGKVDNSELPICILAVDVNHDVHLIEIQNLDKVNEFYSSRDFEEYFEERWEGTEPGVYRATCRVYSWQDNTPDSCDWNAELRVDSIEKVGYVDLPAQKGKEGIKAI